MLAVIQAVRLRPIAELARTSQTHDMLLNKLTTYVTRRVPLWTSLLLAYTPAHRPDDTEPDCQRAFTIW